MSKALRNRTFLALAWLCGMTLAACFEATPDVTQLVIWVSADERVAASLRQVRVALYPTSATDVNEPVRELDFDVTSGEPSTDELQFPFSFSVLAGEARRFKLVVRGYTSRDAESAVIEHKALARFGDERSVELHVRLTKDCWSRARDCVALDRTCSPSNERGVGRGACVPVDDAELADESTQGLAREPNAGPASPLRECTTSLFSDVCDPVVNCGCGPSDRHCQLSAGHSACGPVGEVPKDGACDDNAACAAGLSCMAGVCRPMCRSQEDCAPSDPASFCVFPSRGAIGSCWQVCGVPESAACVEEQSCSPIELDDATRQNLCVKIEDPCSRTNDGRCDEPRIGSGLCAAGTDEQDCCLLPRPGGECDWVTQCGCPEDKSCRVVEVLGVPGLESTACRAYGDRPLGSACDQSSQCIKGTGCFGRLCKAYCRSDEDCEKGACDPITIDGDQAQSAGVCEIPCDYESGEPCLAGSACARLITGTECWVPLNPCPPAFIDNGVCDEYARVCAPGTDSDCKR